MNNPIVLTCDRCELKGCKRCGGQARQWITVPLTQWVGNVWRYVDFFRHAERGHLPVAGGVLDQTAVFLRMLDAWQSARALYRRPHE